MGAYCSIHNDTMDETVMVYVGVNTSIVKPLLWSMTGLATVLSGGVAMGSLPAVISWSVTGDLVVTMSLTTLSTAAGGLVSASQFVLDQLQSQLVADLTKGGYHKCLPGQTYSTRKLTPSLNLRAWIVRIQKTSSAIIIKRCNASVWSGTAPGSHKVYRVLDRSVFSQWTHHETIPLRNDDWYTPQETTTSTTTSLCTNETKQQLQAEDEEEDDPFTLLDSGMKHCLCKIVEHNNHHQPSGNISHDGDFDDSDAWIQVDPVS